MSDAAQAIKLDESWRKPLKPEFDSPYMQALKAFLISEKEAGKRIFPKGGEWFRALDLTDRKSVV